jgi:hypothetical protein
MSKLSIKSSKKRKSKPRIPPTAASPQPSSLPTNTDLHEVSLLLTLIHHRNKNQHRTQKWWKWLCMLRRSMRRLLDFEESKSRTNGLVRREEEEIKLGLERWVREVVLGDAWV